VLVFASPTGSGSINYVFTEALEYMSLGDCAIATMQYSMLPSSMSLTRTGLAIEQNRALIHTITGYLRGMAAQDRPKFDPDGAMLEVDNFGEVLDLELAARADVRYYLISRYVDPIPKIGTNRPSGSGPLVNDRRVVR